jgi:hypothetical protein
VRPIATGLPSTVAAERFGRPVGQRAVRPGGRGESQLKPQELLAFCDAGEFGLKRWTAGLTELRTRTKLHLTWRLCRRTGL